MGSYRPVQIIALDALRRLNCSKWRRAAQRLPPDRQLASLHQGQQGQSAARTGTPDGCRTCPAAATIQRSPAGSTAPGRAGGEHPSGCRTCRDPGRAMNYRLWGRSGSTGIRAVRLLALHVQHFDWRVLD